MKYFRGENSEGANTVWKPCGIYISYYIIVIDVLTYIRLYHKVNTYQKKSV